MQLNFFKFENSTNVTNFNNKIKEFDEKNVLSGISTGYHETNDSFIADLVKIIKIIVFLFCNNYSIFILK